MPYLPNKDFKGIYIFFSEGKPFYVGISKLVIRRILQHIRGTDHFKSSLGYKHGVEHHDRIQDSPFKGKRRDLDFIKWVEPTKVELRKCNIAVMPVERDIELYLFEVYVAMSLGTLNYNTFKTS